MIEFATGSVTDYRKKSVGAYPGYFNVDESPGEAYLANGERESPLSNDRRSPEPNPQNSSAKTVQERSAVK